MDINSYNFWKGKKVFLTGHTGFKGSWLLLWLLKKGATVCGYSLEAEENSLFKELMKGNTSLYSKFENNINNINDFKSLNNKIDEFQPEIIFHLAAQAIVLKSYEEPIQTWQTNVLGSINLLESLKTIKKTCAVVMITTDKVYKNNEWIYGYREIDPLGGLDPYSASKSASEIAINSWRYKYKNSNFNHIKIASVRSGNVIGGGDWAENRIIPDCVRALLKNENIEIRNPFSTRPWLHVLEPLWGYKKLAEKLFISNNNSEYESAFNFGPKTENNKNVEELVNELLLHWPGKSSINPNKNTKEPESKMLNLNSDKSFNLLSWSQNWDFPETIKKTINWYKKSSFDNPFELCLSDINDYENSLFKKNKYR